MLDKLQKQSRISMTIEATDFLFCRQKPFSMREEIPFLQSSAERGLFYLGVGMRDKLGRFVKGYVKEKVRDMRKCKQCNNNFLVTPCRTKKFCSFKCYSLSLKSLTGEKCFGWIDGRSKDKTKRAKYLREWRKKNGITKKEKESVSSGPWTKTFDRIMNRCVYDKNNSYYKRNIKCLITKKELKALWFRDKAFDLKKPSIHRINHKLDYTVDNCKYVELIDNIRRLV